MALLGEPGYLLSLQGRRGFEKSRTAAQIQERLANLRQLFGTRKEVHLLKASSTLKQTSRVKHICELAQTLHRHKILQMKGFVSVFYCSFHWKPGWHVFLFIVPTIILLNSDVLLNSEWRLFRSSGHWLQRGKEIKDVSINVFTAALTENPGDMFFYSL